MFDRLELLLGKDKLKELSEKTILLFGLGGVGSHVAEALVRSGITNLIIVDFDIIDITNLNRQLIALNSTIGQKKVDASRKRLLDINNELNLKTYDIFYDETNKDIVFDQKIDYVIDAIDSVKSKKIIIKECLDRHIPLISCMGTGNKFNPKQLEIIDIRKTSYDPLSKIFRKWVKDERIKDKIMVCSSIEKPIKTDKVVGSNIIVPASAGLLITSYVLKELLK